MAITAETRNDIIELVVTAYDAAPGTTLLTELVAIVDGGGSLADVAAALTTSDRWNDLYPSFQTSEEFAAEWLGALVPEASEEALAEGVSVAVGLLNGGASFADLILEAQGFLSAAAEDDASFGTSAANFNNKVEVATNHTVTNELDGTEDELANVLANVTSDDDSVDEADDEISQGADGSTFNLTDELDTISGTVNNDTVNAVIGAAADTTYNVADTIDLGAGENDQLNVTIVGAHTLAGHGADGVERVNIRYTDDNAATDAPSATLGAFPDVTSVWVQNSSNVDSDNDDTVSITAIPDGTTLGLAGNTSSTDVSFTTDGDDTSGDSVTLMLGGGSTGDVDITDADDGYDTINVVSGGSSSNSIYSLDGGSDSETLVVTGDQNLTLTGIVIAGGLNSSFETVDASGMTGNLSLTVDVTEDSTLTGGSGADTLVATIGDDVNDDAAISGFETVLLFPEATADFNLELIDGASIIGLGAASATNVITLENAADNFTFFGTGTGSATSGDTVPGIDVELADDSGSSNSVAFSLNNLGVDAGTNNQTMGALTVNGIESLTITADNYADLNLTSITGNDLETINYSGDSDLDVGAITANSLESFDGGSATGDIEFTGAVGGTGVDSEIETGAGDDILTLTAITAGHTQVIDSGAGDDELTFANPTAAGVTYEIDLGDGDDEVNWNGAFANISLTNTTLVAGDGEDKLNVSDATISNLLIPSDFESIVVTVNISAVDLSFEDGDLGSAVITETTGNNVEVVAVDGDLDAGDAEFIGGGTLSLIGVDAVDDDITGTDGVDSINAGTGADTINGGDGADTIIIDAGDSINTSLDSVTYGTGDILDLATSVTSLAASANPDLLSAADVASTGTTAATLLTDLQTAADSLAANGFDQAGDTFIVTLTGDSVGGSGAKYLVHNDGANTTVTAADTIIELVGSVEPTTTAHIV